MKSYGIEVQRLLSSAVSVRVYSSYAPEGVPLPVIVHHSLGYQQGRVLKGVRLPDIANYRIMVIAENESDIDYLLTELETLDNTENADFQAIKLSLTYVEPRDPDINIIRAMVNLDLHTRG